LLADVRMLLPGPEMDRQIARKLNGDVKSRPAAYSTSETAAERLLRRLAREGMPATLEAEGSRWYCTIWRREAWSGERVSNGSGETRAAAVARAVLNASFEACAPIPANDAHPILARGLGRATPSGRETPLCRTCGIDLPIRHRSGIHRYCGVCSWNRIKARFPEQPRPA
jgi:hypothetical protein